MLARKRLPWRIPDHNVEAGKASVGVEHFGELEAPLKGLPVEGAGLEVIDYVLLLGHFLFQLVHFELL
jgi:hypothetical protein